MIMTLGWANRLTKHSTANMGAMSVNCLHTTNWSHPLCLDSAVASVSASVDMSS